MWSRSMHLRLPPGDARAAQVSVEERITRAQLAGLAGLGSLLCMPPHTCPPYMPPHVDRTMQWIGQAQDHDACYVRS